MTERATAPAEAVVDRVAETLATADGEFPFVADAATGQWETTPGGNWCPGHWIGALWLAAGTRSDDRARARFERAARGYTERADWERLAPSLFAGMNHRYAGFVGYDATGDESLRRLGVEGADRVVDLYDPRAGVIPVGSFATRGLEDQAAATPETTAAVDAAYTAASVLWRAAAETGLERYREVAEAHAATHVDWFARDDGGVWHKATYDPEDGLERRYDQLTSERGACWSRGLGWSVAGLAEAYRHTGADRYLDALERHAEFYRRTTPDDDVAHAELGGTAPPRYRDTSASALVAYGLLGVPGDGTRERELRAYGRRVREALVADYLVTEGPLRGQLRAGCYNPVDGIATEHELVWSTYYLLASLLERE
jgi:unsaturated chondroitin disaccharide hydrolase